MAKVTVIGTFRCHEGRGDEMEALLARMVDAARGEPGVEVYSYHRGEGEVFWFFALMADEASVAGHGRGAAMRALMDEFGPLAAGPPRMSTARPVGALGLPV